MAGGIAQYLAAEYPDRVATLTRISTSPGASGGPTNDLPPVADRLTVTANPAPDPDWSDRDAVVEYQVPPRSTWDTAVPATVQLTAT